MAGNNWVKLIEVPGQLEATLLESYLKAHGIETELIQEAYDKLLGLGSVQILVPNYQLAEARNLYEKSGWDFDVTETDDDDEDQE